MLSPGGIAVVKITSRGHRREINALMQLILNQSQISVSGIYRYAPPEHVSHSHSRKYNRVERLQKIKNPNLNYVVIDDFIHSGNTLNCSIQALEKQGVPQNNIWFLGDILYDDGSVKDGGPFLDKASLFFDYAASR